MRVTIIGNCQSWMLAQYMRSVGVFENVACIDINQRGTEMYDADVQTFMEDAASIAITHPLSDQFGNIATKALRATNRAMLTTTNFYFAGLHPDIFYLGGFQGRIASPAGDYHSRLVVASYVQGVSAKECLARFNSKTYEQAGYYATFDGSAGELLARDENIDVQLAKPFAERLRLAPTMMTVNHPVMEVIAMQAGAILTELNLSATPFPASYMLNPLSDSSWLPIYPEIREAAGLAYSTPMAFKAPNDMRPIPLEAFVAGSYAAYAEQHDMLMQAGQIAEARRVFEFFL